MSKSELKKWLLALGAGLLFSLPCAASEHLSSFYDQVLTLESNSGGRIGLYAINTADKSTINYRANERFPMGCTSKAIGVAAALHKSMKDKSLLSQSVSIKQSDLTNWSPITKKFVNQTLSVEQLCAAAITHSDNTAMNLLVKQIGGLGNINGYARTLHNDSFRQDHDWPAESLSGGRGTLDDSSTPEDMAKSLEHMAFGNSLGPLQREQLLSWMKSNTTGDARIKAGVPKDWIVGDKTGTGSLYGTTNDIAIIWPPHCAPLVIAVYYSSDDKNATIREDIVAAVTKLILLEFGKKNSCIRKDLLV